MSFGEMAPYAHAALRYLELGWGPLPVTGKGRGRGNGPPRGRTGRNGVAPQRNEVEYWVSDPERGAKNVALRLPEGVVGVDVDAYGEKRGRETLAELEGTRGVLPPTWVSGSRDDGASGIRFYAVPLNWQAPPVFGAGIECISWHYRYAVAWPSTHPETGLKYKWRRLPDWEPCDPPAVEVLPPFPENWLDGWQHGSAAAAAAATGNAVWNGVDEGEHVDIDVMIQEGAGPSGGRRHERLRLTQKLAGIGRSEVEALAIWRMIIASTEQDSADPWTDEHFHSFFRSAQERTELSRQERQLLAPSARLLEWVTNATTHHNGIPHPNGSDAGDGTDNNTSDDNGTGDGDGNDGTDNTGTSNSENPRPRGVWLADDALEDLRLLARTLQIRETRGGRRGLLISRPESPLDVARELMGIWDEQNGVPRLAHGRGGWHEYDGTSWCDVAVDELTSRLYRIMRQCVYIADVETGQLAWWNPSSGKMSMLLEALAALCQLHEAIEEPSWLRGIDGGDVIPCRNGLLSWRGDKVLLPSSSAFFCHYTVQLDWTSGAVCPAWHAFLESIWPGDEESKALLREWFGYILSGRTDMEKMLVVIGPRRSGKGTMATVLSSLLGKPAVAAPTLSSFTSNFGLASLISKPLAVIGDAREARSTDLGLVTERLLAITGRDALDIDRKYRAVWTGVLSTRIMLMANQFPRFKDESGAITGRMLLLATKRSFFGDEDLGLKDRLAQPSELAGIMNWALEGLESLDQRRYFTEPAASAALREEVLDDSQPLVRFLEECCDIAPTNRVTCVDIYARWLIFEGRGGDANLERWFGRQLRTAVAAAGGTVRKIRPTLQGVRTWMYEGISLKAALPAFASQRLQPELS